MPIKRKIIEFESDAEAVIKHEKEQIANDLYINVNDINWDISIDNCDMKVIITYRY